MYHLSRISFLFLLYLIVETALMGVLVHNVLHDVVFMFDDGGPHRKVFEIKVFFIVSLFLDRTSEFREKNVLFIYCIVAKDRNTQT